MRLPMKILAGCVFALGVGLGLLVAAGAWWWLKTPAFVSPTTADNPAEAGDSAVGRIERAIQADAKLVDEIEKLLEIPEVREALEDPGIVEALENKQYVKLMRNPRFRSLAAHPAMRELSALVLKRSLADLFGRAPTTAPPPTDTTPATPGPDSIDGIEDRR